MKYLWLCLALAVKRGQVSGRKNSYDQVENVRHCFRFSIHDLFAGGLLHNQCSAWNFHWLWPGLHHDSWSTGTSCVCPGTAWLREEPLRFLESNMRHWLQRFRNSCPEFASGPGSPPDGSEISRIRSRLQERSTTAWARRRSRGCTATCTWRGTASEASCWRPGSRTTRIAPKVLLEGEILMIKAILFPTGIILLGSYLPDLFGSHENVFQVPVLTAVGELDGLTISFVFRSSIFYWHQVLILLYSSCNDNDWLMSGSGKNLRRQKTWLGCLDDSPFMLSMMQTMDRSYSHCMRCFVKWIEWWDG